MRKTFFLVAAIAGLAASGMIALMLSGEIGDAMVRAACSGEVFTDRCRNSVRANGHLWAARGNLERAQQWYAYAAERDDPVAMFHLAWTYEELGRSDIERIKTEEFKHLAQYHPEADVRSLPKIQELLAADPAYREKIAQAKRWYEISSAMNFAPSMNNLGQLYIETALGENDIRTSHRWHMEAALAGNPIGRINAAMDISERSKTPVDREKSFELLYWDPASTDTRDLLNPTYRRTRSKFLDSRGVDYSTFWRAKILEMSQDGKEVVLPPKST